MDTEQYTETIREIYERIQSVRKLLIQSGNRNDWLTTTRGNNLMVVQSYLGDYLRHRVLLSGYQDKGEEHEIHPAQVYFSLGRMVISVCCAFPDLDWSKKIVSSPTMSVQEACDETVYNHSEYANKAQLLVNLWGAVINSSHGIERKSISECSECVVDTINQIFSGEALGFHTTIMRVQENHRRFFNYVWTGRTDTADLRPLTITQAINLFLREYTNDDWMELSTWNDLSDDETQVLFDTCVLWHSIMGKGAWDDFAQFMCVRLTPENKLVYQPN